MDFSYIDQVIENPDSNKEDSIEQNFEQSEKEKQKEQESKDKRGQGVSSNDLDWTRKQLVTLISILFVFF